MKFSLRLSGRRWPKMRRSGRTRSPRHRSARHRAKATGPVGPSSFGPLLLSSSVAVALARLITHGLGTRVLIPLLVTIVVADVATALALRLRISVLLAVGLGWAVSLWAMALAVDPVLFDPISSHFLHAAELVRQLRAAQFALANDGTPLPSLNGMVGIVAAIGGLGAALTRGIWAIRWRRSSRSDRGPLSPCLAPSFAIFIYSILVSAEQDRVPAFIAYFLGVLVFVALADRVPAPTRAAAPTPLPGAAAPPPPRWRRYGAGLGALLGALLMVAVVIAAGAGLSGLRLTAFHTSPAQAGLPNASVPGGTAERVTGDSLVDRLLAAEISESHVLVFHARSSVTTYWQVGTLSTFNGTEWLPTASVSGALDGSTSGKAAAAALGADTLPTPASQHAFSAKVTIADFVSHLLPAPPAATAVHGLAGVSVINQEGVLSSRSSGAGTTYTVDAGFDTTIPANGSQLAASDPRLAPYLALPTEPAVVARLAHEAVGNATTPAAKAQDLIDWFRSGQFRYTLSPPATHGANPLVQFLTVTKAGYCAQFAGAYGVLARTLGIPTRLVVGFTPGVAGTGDSFTVTGGDAHVWPQVYLGLQAGWVSVEPTPGTPPAEGVLGVAPATPGQTTTPSTVVRRVKHPVTRPHHHHHSHVARPQGGWRWWMAGVIVAGLVVLTLLALWVRRIFRARKEARLPPDQRVVRSWERALGALRRQGLGRRTEETPGEYAIRVQMVDHQTTESPGAAESSEAEAVTRLAELVELACYSAQPCTPDQAAAAQRLASSVVEANRGHLRHRRRRRQRRLAAHLVRA
jgi:transglutaminase-like putative cysteine protease